MKTKISPSEVIPQRIGIEGVYHIDVEWEDIPHILRKYEKIYNLELNPDFQRGHVWTKKQQIAYVEYVMSGGFSGKDVFFNYPGWQVDYNTDNVMVCVDGLQRLTAVLKFMNNELKVWGKYSAKNFTHLPTCSELHFYINGLTKRADVLRWYIEMNSGGTPHSKKEIQRVTDLLKQETG